MNTNAKVAIVTGAGRGIGYAITEQLARAGATVVIGELVESRGQQAADSLRRAGLNVDALPLDVTQPESCRAVVKRMLADYGRIDVLVNNAGLFELYKSEDMPEESWRRQIDVLLNGVFFMTQAVARGAMIPQRSGSIVNIASIGGMGGQPLRSAYNAAKAAVIVLSLGLATEWAQFNIRVNCISPGVTRTEMVEAMIRTRTVNVEKYERRTPLGRLAGPEEIANAVSFLASERSGFITGQNLRVDGGWVPYANLEALGFPEE